MPYSGIHELINYGEGKVVFWTRLVKVGKIYADPPFAIMFVYKYRVGYPFQVYCFSDEPIIFQSLHLLF